MFNEITRGPVPTVYCGCIDACYNNCTNVCNDVCPFYCLTDYQIAYHIHFHEAGFMAYEMVGDGNYGPYPEPPFPD